MGQLAFGKDYGMVRNGKKHWALELLSKGMDEQPARIPTWLFRVLIAIPGLAAGFKKFAVFCESELEWRVKNQNAEGDITGWLLKSYKDVANPAKDDLLVADSKLISK